MIVRAGRPSVHALALACVAASVLAAGALLPLDLPPLALLACPFRAATGFPCIGCGGTHAFHFAVRGQFLLALSWSPLGALAAIAAATHVVWTALRLVGLPFAPRIEATPALRWTAAAALAANWLFVVWSGRV
jgi:hypothetical protein